MLARLFVIVGGLFVLALCAALVGPYFVDWTSYRSDFERQASAVLGRKVTVLGEASAKLLPFPSVTFTDVFPPPCITRSGSTPSSLDVYTRAASGLECRAASVSDQRLRIATVLPTAR